ncbi:DUF1467 family protein [Roseomonas sp. AR75]|jgi:predicted secreted protein|uniref:DUF1467 family protein n=1 Tax=Roseomonas sp. AR75 TaxID=2562311 RepID=UPI0010BFAB31|nr:DUF1467 family protein [Roseomonas sp. AR75]
MDWFTGIIVYLLIWWLTLFAVLPVGTRPVEEADPEAGGWRGAPTRPQLLRKAIATTLIAGVLWLGAYALIASDLVSFREGWLAYEGPAGR